MEIPKVKTRQNNSHHTEAIISKDSKNLEPRNSHVTKFRMPAIKPAYKNGVRLVSTFIMPSENSNICNEWANGLRHRPRVKRVGYLRWGRDGEAVQPEKGSGVEKCLGCAHAAEGGSPQRQVH
ncbi:MAG TPA: hypothetical protein PLX90_05945, partial [Anaerolineales bacterium]|nr:hypothetical protein [Anaerolineales bacterium]